MRRAQGPDSRSWPNCVSRNGRRSDRWRNRRLLRRLCGWVTRPVRRGCCTSLNARRPRRRSRSRVPPRWPDAVATVRGRCGRWGFRNEGIQVDFVFIFFFIGILPVKMYGKFRELDTFWRYRLCLTDEVETLGPGHTQDRVSTFFFRKRNTMITYVRIYYLLGGWLSIIIFKQ